MTDLKEVLMHLGNKLVTEHGYDPAMRSRADRNVHEIELCANATDVINTFTIWMNEHPEAQEVLQELGFKWSMPKKKGE